MKRLSLIKNAKLITVLTILCLVVMLNTKQNSSVAAANEESSRISQKESLRRIILQDELWSAGNRLRDQGRYEESIDKYRLAADPSLCNYSYDAVVPLMGMVESYKMLGRFDEALKILNPLVVKYPKKEHYADLKLEIEGFAKSSTQKSFEPIREHIQYLKTKYKTWLPPYGCEDMIAGRIIYLYDHIGDLEGGIKFIDSIHQYFRTGKAGEGIKKVINTPKNPYYPILQGFLEDKKTGEHPNCLGKPACFGRGTKALIASDQIPW